MFFQSVTSEMSYFNILDPDMAQPLVEPDMGLNCLQSLLADNTRRQETSGGSRGGLFDPPSLLTPIFKYPMKINENSFIFMGYLRKMW